MSPFKSQAQRAKFSREDLAWAGGLFEGEGCFSFGHAGGKGGVACLTTTDPDVIRRFADIFPFGKIYKPRMNKGGTKPHERWNVYRFEHLQAFIAMIWPWLGIRRRARAKEILLQCRS